MYIVLNAYKQTYSDKNVKLNDIPLFCVVSEVVTTTPI